MATNDMTVNSRRFICPHCGAFSGQEWKPLCERVASGWGNGEMFSYIVDGEPELINPLEIPEDVMWQASYCASCLHHSLWVGQEMVFPAKWVVDGIAAPHVDMPNHVAELYREAAAVLPHSRRAAAALSRAALERLVKVLTPEMDKKVQLNGRLAALCRVVAPETAKGLQMIRYIGNEALHGTDEREDNGAVTLYLDDREGSELVGLLFRAINDLVEQRISSPKKYDEFFEMMPDGFKAAIERSDAEHRARQAVEVD